MHVSERTRRVRLLGGTWRTGDLCRRLHSKTHRRGDMYRFRNTRHLQRNCGVQVHLRLSNGGRHRGRHSHPHPGRYYRLDLVLLQERWLLRRLLRRNPRTSTPDGGGAAADAADAGCHAAAAAAAGGPGHDAATSRAGAACASRSCGYAAGRCHNASRRCPRTAEGTGALSCAEVEDVSSDLFNTGQNRATREQLYASLAPWVLCTSAYTARK
jgi:hypothetical protein